MNKSPNEEDIFRVAFEIQSKEVRMAYLKQVCRDDSGVERIVELLKAASHEDNFLEREPAQCAPTEFLSGHIEKTGDFLGPYKLLQQIGEGGFGVVYLAEQTDPVRRRVAVKIIKPGMDTRQIVARFEAERQALALMDHPNIAKVLDGGATQSGKPYFVMELVKGVPLTEFCKANQLDLRQRLRLFAQVCKAIQHAHHKGVIHRDIKPSNVLVTLHDGEPVPKVIDFGIAKAIAQQLTDKTMFTAHGQMIGTPQYMSPEQAEMSGLDIDTRSDVYSLGILLYELLTGTTPLDKGKLRDKLFQELQRLIRDNDPELPSRRLSAQREQSARMAADMQVDERRLARTLRGELDWIVMKSLEKDRRRRYESPNAIAVDINNYLEDKPVGACSPSASYRCRKFVWRNRSKLIPTTIACALLLLVAGFVIQNRMAQVQKIVLIVSSIRSDNVTTPRDGLLDFPRGLVERELTRQFDSASDSRKLSLAIVMAHFNDEPIQYLLSKGVDGASSDDFEFLLDIFKKRDAAGKAIQEAAQKADYEKDWRRKARLAILSLHLGDSAIGKDAIGKDMCVLGHDLIQRTWFISELAQWHGDRSHLAGVVNKCNAVELRQLRLCIVQAIGASEPVSPAEKTAWKKVLDKLFNAQDASTHSAASFALQKFGLAPPKLKATQKLPRDFSWHVNSVGMTMCEIPAGQMEWLDENGKPIEIEPSGKTITVDFKQPFLLSDREITYAQFWKFFDAEKPKELEDWREFVGGKLDVPATSKLPVQGANWRDAVLFCNWLSDQEGLTPCYHKNEARSEAPLFLQWRLDRDANGYRLPTEFEWEYACRAGTTTTYGHGDSVDFLPQYAVYNLLDSTGPESPATRLPNAWGLFDMHGNLFEWCQNIVKGDGKKVCTESREILPGKPMRLGFFHYGFKSLLTAERELVASFEGGRTITTMMRQHQASVIPRTRVT